MVNELDFRFTWQTGLYCHWHLHESFVASVKTSSQNCSCSLDKSHFTHRNVSAFVIRENAMLKGTSEFFLDSCMGIGMLQLNMHTYIRRLVIFYLKCTAYKST